MNNFYKFTFREFLVVILSGGVPLVIAYLWGGIDYLKNTLGSLVVSDLILIYSLIFPPVYVVIYFVDKFLYIEPMSKKKKTLRFFLSVFKELSSNILGILRCACGLLITIPFLVLIVEFDSSAQYFLGFLPYGLLGFIEVTLFSYWLSEKA